MLLWTQQTATSALLVDHMGVRLPLSLLSVGSMGLESLQRYHLPYGECPDAEHLKAFISTN